MEKDLDSQSMSSAQDDKKSKKEKESMAVLKKKNKVLKDAFQKERKLF